MTRWILGFCIFLGVHSGGFVFAYDCMPPSVEECYNSFSDHIFTAKVLASDKQQGNDFSARTKYIVEVMDIYKGDLKGEIDIFRETYWGDVFETGKEYLIFANLVEKDIVVPVCSRTLILQHEFSVEYIEKLKSISSKKVEKN